MIIKMEICRGVDAMHWVYMIDFPLMYLKPWIKLDQEMLYYEGIRYIYISQPIWNQSIKTNDITSRLMEIDVL